MKRLFSDVKSEEREVARTMLEEGENNLKKIMAACQEKIKNQYPNNSKLDSMINSFDFTVECLLDKEAETRKLAFAVLDAFYPDSQIKGLFPIFEKLAFCDSDIDVKKNALRYLGIIASFHCPEYQKEIGKKLANIILDKNADIEFRKGAYKALLLLSPNYDFRAKAQEFVSFPEELDWMYVRSWA